MNTAQWALLISIFSATVACLSLGWNIYKELALRARVKVTIAIGNFLTEGRKPSEDHILVQATNFGPGKIKLETIRLKKNPSFLQMFWRPKHAVLIHDYSNLLGSKLPITLDVGERVMYPFVLREDCFLAEDYTHIGIYDSFGRIHWASRKEYAKTQKHWRNLSRQ